MLAFGTSFFGAGAVAIGAIAEPVSGFNFGGSGSGTVSSSIGPSVVVDGGVEPFTYAWEHVATYSGSTPAISNAAIINPVWNATVSDGTESRSLWKLTVTDNNGQMAVAQTTVTLIWASTI